MKKILIYQKKSKLKPIGGPAGYLYSLNEGLNLINNHYEIAFIPEKGNNEEGIKEAAKTSANVVVKKLLQIYRELKHLKMCLDILYKQENPDIDFEQYDAIHFHKTLDVYRLRDKLSQYKGKVILTSHSPQPLSNEIIEGVSNIEAKILGKKMKELIQMDEFAFSRADYIVFPCETADEPYENAWNDYSKIKASKKDRYYYFSTGTVKAQLKVSRNDIREKYNIPQDAFLISYVGRHNEIKGYGRLKSICQEILRKKGNVYVIVAGNIGPIMPLENERWIEVGWTNDPHSIIGASDLFILPNKETYFDLVLLEVLSIGVPVLVSNTGGNKYFRKYGYDGIRIFETDADCVRIANEIMNYSEEMREKVRKQNVELFEAEFTTEHFARGYLEVLDSIFRND